MFPTAKAFDGGAYAQPHLDTARVFLLFSFARD